MTNLTIQQKKKEREFLENEAKGIQANYQNYDEVFSVWSSWFEGGRGKLEQALSEYGDKEHYLACADQFFS